MASISPKLPLYRSNKTLKETTKQNFKCLMLTSPGERIMDPAFGVGLRRYLFEPAGTGLSSKIEKKIIDQTKRYLPFIKIMNIIVRGTGETVAQSSSSAINLRVTIVYNIIPLQAQDTIELGIN